MKPCFHGCASNIWFGFTRWDLKKKKSFICLLIVSLCRVCEWDTAGYNFFVPLRFSCEKTCQPPAIFASICDSPSPQTEKVQQKV